LLQVRDALIKNPEKALEIYNKVLQEKKKKKEEKEKKEEVVEDNP
jgi:hypothetical protein